MLKVGIIIGSTRPGRRGEAVARWVYDIAVQRDDAEFEIVDLKDFGLPLLDEPLPPMTGRYEHPHTLAWAEKIASFDAYIFVTPEYNRSIPGALKNVIDFLYAEWNDKAAAFVGYGATGGVRAVEQLRLITSVLKIADVRTQVELSLSRDFQDFDVLAPAHHHTKLVTTMLDELIAWGGAMRVLRSTSEPTSAEWKHKVHAD